MTECINCMFDLGLSYRERLASDLRSADEAGDDAKILRLEYLMQELDGLLTVLTSTVSIH